MYGEKLFCKTPCHYLNFYIKIKKPLTHGKRAADTIRYNQLLVIWDPRPRTNIRQVSWLIIPHTKQPSQFPSGCKIQNALYSLNTVTRSCRILTCFPFNRIKIQHLIFFLFNFLNYTTLFCQIQPSVQKNTIKQSNEEAVFPSLLCRKYFISYIYSTRYIPYSGVFCKRQPDFLYLFLTQQEYYPDLPVFWFLQEHGLQLHILPDDGY